MKVIKNNFLLNKSFSNQIRIRKVAQNGMFINKRRKRGNVIKKIRFWSNALVA